VQMAGVVQEDEAGPLRRLALQCGKRAVRHGEPAPERRLQPQGVTEDRPERPAVGGNKGRFPSLRRRIEYAARPSCQRGKILAADGAADLPTPDPGVPLLRKPTGDLLAGQPFPMAVVAFAEIRSLRNEDPFLLFCRDDPGCLAGPPQVARIDHLQVNFGQPFRQDLRLQPSPLIQRDIGPALNPLILIPLRFAVTNQINNGDGSPPLRLRAGVGRAPAHTK